MKTKLENYTEVLTECLTFDKAKLITEVLARMDKIERAIFATHLVERFPNLAEDLMRDFEVYLDDRAQIQQEMTEMDQ
jgi:hypothetical protein